MKNQNRTIKKNSRKNSEAQELTLKVRIKMVFDLYSHFILVFKDK
jgi:hypothetical protein